jgi:16S rRNA G966 N2-methylase RsmD
MPTRHRQPETIDLNDAGAVSLAVEAEERGAQLALAVETISDELGQILADVSEPRSALLEHRIVLDELEARAARLSASQGAGQEADGGGSR